MPEQPPPRRNTAIDRYLIKSLTYGEPIADKMEKNSDWISAGSGAAIIAFISHGAGESGARPHWATWALGFLTLTLAFGAWAKLLAYFFRVSNMALTYAVRNVAELRVEVAAEREVEALSDEEFQQVLEDAFRALKPRLRIPASLLVNWARERGRKDFLTLPTWANACLQFMVIALFCQFLCLLNAAICIIFGPL